MKLRWTVPAVTQLESIFDYIAADNPAAADRTVKRIRNAILAAARLSYMSRIGRVRGTREIVVPGTSYLVAFKIVKDSVHVLAILHGARLWPESF